MMKNLPLYAAALTAGAMITLTSDAAEACGGFFCAGAGPNQVNQAAERIVFAQHPDNSVTAVVQIMYAGPADRFGWLLPVPGIPEVGLSSDAAFTRLQNATNPQYNLNRSVEGECRQDDNRRFANNATAAPESANNGSVADDGNGGGVNVLARGNTGPYDYVVIQVDAEDNKTQLALDWLEDNNYEVTNVGPELIGPYLDDGFNLLAIRLQKTQESGSVRPIKLTYDSDRPMIPIKLTAVAATDDMGVMTWVLGSDRAVPVNYKALELNDALLNWFNPTSNYNDVVIAAANEASGQGFVTEYADDSSTLENTIWTQNDQNNWDYVRNETWTVDRASELLEYAFFNFSVFDQNTFNQVAFDGIDQVVSETMPNLSAEERMELMQCPWCFVDDGKLPADFDPQAWVDAMKEYMIDPMIETQELFDASEYTTRMYTTMSANEMTRDPAFDFNPDLPAKSNINTADMIIECSSQYYQWEAPFRVELPSGLVVRGADQNTWPIGEGPMMPATLRVSEVGTSGEGEVVRDNYATVQQQLEIENAKVPDPLEKRPVGGGGACSVAGSSSGFSLLALLGFVGIGRLRRRRSN